MGGDAEAIDLRVALRTIIATRARHAVSVERLGDVVVAGKHRAGVRDPAG